MKRYDSFDTAIPLVRAAARRYNEVQGLAYPDAPLLVIDAGAGDGRWGIEFKRNVRNVWKVVAVDTGPLYERSEIDTFLYGRDFLTIGADELEWYMRRNKAPYDTRIVVVGNPPFSKSVNMTTGAAEAFMRHGLELGTDIYMLLRLAILESASRKPFWEQYGNDVIQIHPLVERPIFTGSNSDQKTAYAMFWIGAIHVEYRIPAVYPLSWKGEEK
jgi:predicted RNA methylase